MVLSFWRQKGKRIAGAIGVLIIGVVLSSFHFFPALPAQGEYLIEGTLIGDVKEREEFSYAVKVGDVRLNGEKTSLKGYWTFLSEDVELVNTLEDGSRVAFYGRVYHPQKQQNPSGFDFFNYLRRQGITLGLYGNKELAVTKREGPSLSHSLYTLRKNIETHLDKIMGESAPLAQAMVLGSKEDLDEDIQKTFSTIGIAHVLAISGLHISIIAFMLLSLVQKMPIGIKGQWWFMAAVLGLYTLFVGGSPSVVRASLLFLVLLGGKATGRGYDELTSLAFAALVILVFRPSELFSPGFQLSFSAVGGIVLLRGPILKGLQKWIKGEKFTKLLASFAVTAGAQLGVMLPMAYWFHHIPLLGIFVNLIVLPYVSMLVIPCYFVTAILAFVPGLGVVLGAISRGLSIALVEGSRLLAQIPGMEIKTKMPEVWFCVLIVAGMILCSLYVKMKRKNRGLVLLTGSLVCITLSLVTQHFAPPTYIQFSAGQADTAVLQDGAFTAVIDTGEEGTDLANYLLHRGRKIDWLFISHLHMDHVGGVAALLEKEVEIGRVLLPYGAKTSQIGEDALNLLKALEEKNIPISELAATDEMAFPRGKFNVLWPASEKVKKGQDGNHYSLVMKVDVLDTTLLTTGDVTGGYEGYVAQGADILKVAHHGSANSTSTAFLEQVTPQVALITSGTSTRLPSPKTLQRLEEKQIKVYDTHHTGSVTIVFSDKGYRVIPYY